MGAVALNISMSLDGYVAGPDPGPDQPLGAGGEQLHDWAYGLATFNERHGREGGTTGPDDDILRETFEHAGSVLIGRNMFGGGPGPWGDEPWEGWWGDEPPFGVPVLVVTHHEREPLVKGDTTFTFVTDGVESAVAQARAAAGERDVSLGGGADVAQQCLAAGLVDEMHIHLAPILLGGGVRLFEPFDASGLRLEKTRVVDSPAVTHLRYRVTR
jgi:dihydrofolate reductase